MQNSLADSQKVETVMPPNDFISKYLPKRKKTNARTKTFFHADVHSSNVIIVKQWDLHKYPSAGEWIGNCGVPHNGILFSNKRRQTIDTHKRPHSVIPFL